MAEINIPQGPIDEAPWGAILINRASERPAEVFQAAIRAALEGVEMGAQDERIVAWLAQWDIPTVATVCSLLYRVRAASVPQRGDAVEAWLIARRQGRPTQGPLAWSAIDDMLTTYRAHADAGIPLDKELPCWCEYVDIGVGYQKVDENPDCPRCVPPSALDPAQGGEGQ